MMSKLTIGIIGAGKLGMTLAKLGIDAGYTINISGSKAPEKIDLSVSVLAKGANTMLTKDVIENSDVIILALPLSKYHLLDSKLLKDKIVIDAMNYWWEIDGDESQYYDEKTTSSENVQKYFAESIIIKAFNHMGYHDLAATTGKNQAMVYAGNNQEALEKVAEIIKDFGFVPYYLGTLDQTNPLQPHGSLFGVSADVTEVEKILSK
ncbi:NADPH-dependent F420 reductase [Companilactobacillus halodurans]|uniref:NADP oxidoreductase n=1 Tax=Companilactobacillus halodurans TaxID=2584183 RepID=A0A5P0ZXL7_9LACO|nr:NAD(P)-binding domain-containing protein [Companilactobacillus halodurans]MQS75545.1 NADP oxidoreductase [Companilactobacillus halodurans]MQS97789.1 NADP oxidoreductase [Companilactobacillus halodurans]